LFNIVKKTYRCTHVKSKPGICGTKKDLSVCITAEIFSEIGPCNLGAFYTLNDVITLEVSSGQSLANIFGSLQNVVLDIHREAWGFWDGKTEL
jgi:hypothetical protein